MDKLVECCLPEVNSIFLGQPKGVLRRHLRIMWIELLRHVAGELTPYRRFGSIRRGNICELAKSSSDEHCRSSRSALAPKRAGELLHGREVSKFANLQSCLAEGHRCYGD